MKDEVAPRWHNLAIQIQKSTTAHILNAIEENHHHDLDKCFTEMMEYWLNNFEATWNKIIDALTQIKQTELAEDIKRKDDIKGFY